MDRKEKLGKFIRKRDYTVNGEEITFIVRGLTSSEYLDLSMQTDLTKISNSLYIEIAIAGIIGWENIEFEDSDGNKDTDVNYENIQYIPENILLDLGKYIYHRLTVLSDEETEKLRGYIRFIFWVSDDDNKKAKEKFECENCIKNGYAKNRPCGRFTDDEIDKKYALLNDKSLEETKNDEEKNMEEITNRYSTQKKKTYASEKEYEQDKSSFVRNDGSMKVGDWVYPECPVSWVDDHLKELGSALQFCQNHDTQFFDGGLADQLYKFYQAYRVVESEANKIEKEEMEEARED